jgi:hypothetical protein
VDAQLEKNGRLFPVFFKKMRPKVDKCYDTFNIQKDTLYHHFITLYRRFIAIFCREASIKGILVKLVNLVNSG